MRSKTQKVPRVKIIQPMTLMTKICVPHAPQPHCPAKHQPRDQIVDNSNFGTLLQPYTSGTKLCLHQINNTVSNRLAIMSSDDGVNSRKRRLEIDDEGTTSTTTATSRATQAQENKRRQIQQSSWGFREVLVECGLLDFATNGTSGDLEGE